MPANVDGVTLTAAALGSGVINGPGDLPRRQPGRFRRRVRRRHAPELDDLEPRDQRLRPRHRPVLLRTGCSVDPVQRLRRSPATTSRCRPTSTPRSRRRRQPEHRHPLRVRQNQMISNNIIDLPGDGVSDSGAARFSSSVGMQSNTSGGSVYDGLMITGNDGACPRRPVRRQPGDGARHLGERPRPHRQRHGRQQRLPEPRRRQRPGAEPAASASASRRTRARPAP